MQVPLSIYIRLINYASAALSDAGIYDSNIDNVSTTLDIANAQFIPVESCTAGVVQTLNIGSQSSGSGAGKIQFNAVTITRFMDAVSPVLFQSSASGTAFKTMEVFYTDTANAIIFKQTYKLVAVKSITWSTTTGQQGIAETISFEYGGLILTTIQQDTAGQTFTIQDGWNLVKNISDNDVTTGI